MQHKQEQQRPAKAEKSPKTSKTGRAAKTPKQKTWRVLAPAAIRDRLMTAVHFSSKPVNTNARAAGVRLGSEKQLAAPLIGFVTTALNRRVVDYQDGAVAGSMLSQCASVIEGRAAADYIEVPPEQVALIQAQATVLDQHAAVGTEVIDARLRQVLLPTPTGYVALTPLHSSVFSAHLRNVVEAEAQRRAKDGDAAYRPRTLLMVGGSKAQNVGRITLVGAMQRALVFGAPREDQGLRSAYALYYKGPRLTSLVRRQTLNELSAWRESNRNEDGRIESTASLRDHERALVARVGQEAATILEQHRSVVAPYVDILGGWASPELNDFTRGFLDKDHRSREWSREFAGSLLRIVESHKRGQDARPMAGFGDVSDYLEMIMGGLA